MKFRFPKKDCIFCGVLTAVCLGLYFIPSPAILTAPGGRTVPARVLQTDDSELMMHGLIPAGSQILQVVLLAGEKKGAIFPAANELRGQLELDKRFRPGDRITVVLSPEAVPGQTVLTAKDHDRSCWTGVLFGSFCLLLILFGRWTGVKALFSFLFSCLVIFKLVIPLTLQGIPASPVIAGSTLLLTGIIIFLVAGLNRKGLAAFSGAAAGVLAGLAMAHLFGRLLHINGAVMPFVQPLLYSGFEQLDMADIFTGAVILACSGAVMDLAMDIASAAEELHYHNPGLSMRELTRSCFRIGRSVVGTMTTTLLLAYSGGYLTLMMMFTVQGTHPVDIINNPLVAAEMTKTLIGSFSLVLVAPLTAIASGWIFCRKNPKEGEK